MAVTQFVDSLMAVPLTHIHHVMVVRHGTVIAEAHPAPYRAEDAHTLYSCSKTFVALAVGIAVNENRLRLTDRVATFFPDKLPATVSPRLAQMTVRDLLTMASGIKPDWVMRNHSTNWVADWLAKDIDYTPGEFFQYDSMCSFMLAAIVQRVTGTTMLDYLDQHLFAPMHITVADWEQSPDGINTGGWGLRLQAEALAKVGILMLNRGMWEGRQLISAEWIDEAVAPHINYANVKPGDAPTEGNQGYGYQVWRCKNPRAFRADGAFGQYVVCIPDADIVVVITGMSGSGHGELNCIWQYLMPGVDNEGNDVAKWQQALERTCAGAALPVVKGKKSPKNLPSKLVLEPNKHGISSIQLTHAAGTQLNMNIHYTDGRNELLAMGCGEWLYSKLNSVPPYSIEAHSRFKGVEHNFVAAACYATTGKNIITARIEYVNWISATTFSLNLSDSTVTVAHNWTSAKPETIKFTCQ